MAAPPSWLISNGHILRNGSRSTNSAHRAVIFAIAQLSCYTTYSHSSFISLTAFSSYPLFRESTRLITNNAKKTSVLCTEYWLITLRNIVMRSTDNTCHSLANQRASAKSAVGIAVLVVQYGAILRRFLAVGLILWTLLPFKINRVTSTWRLSTALQHMSTVHNTYTHNTQYFLHTAQFGEQWLKDAFLPEVLHIVPCRTGTLWFWCPRTTAQIPRQKSCFITRRS